MTALRQRWRQLTVGASVALLVGSAIAVLWPARPGTSRPSTSSDAGTSVSGCAESQLQPPALLPSANATYVVLEAMGAVLLQLDGKQVFSPREAPKRFGAGEHTVSLLTASGQPIQSLRVRLEPFQPALFVAEADGPIADTTLVWLGAQCLSCEMGEQELDLDAVGKPVTSVSEAAKLQQRGEWEKVPAALRGIPAEGRRGVAYARLTIAALNAAGARAEAQSRFKQLAVGRGPMVNALLEAFEKLESSERKRESEVLLERWNLLTERFSRLTSAASGDANAAIASASERMSGLSQGFADALKRKDVVAQEEMVRTGEETVRVFLKAARAAHPDDCEFQQRLAQAF